MKKIILMIAVLFGSIGSFAQMDEAVQQMNEDELDRIRQQNESTANVNNSIGEALGHVNNFLGMARDAQDLYNASRSLGSNECTPDFSTSGEAMMASTCAGNSSCSECYTKAVNDMNFVRRQLGRMSCIYNNTKNFNDAAIAFGDNASGIHAVNGLAWQQERAGIVQTFDKFKQTYDRKYTEMIGSLDRALRAIDACERQYGQPDWYQRFGFIFFEFMKEKYKRSD